MENLDKLVLELCKLSQETGWIEFKHNNCDPKMVGEDISALANSAVIADRSYAYMIWGIDDNTHEIIGTKVNLKKRRKVIRDLKIGYAIYFPKMPISRCILLILTASMSKCWLFQKP